MAQHTDESICYSLEAYPDADFLARPATPLPDHAFALIREALFFNDEAYRTVRDHVRPMGRGAFLLFVIVILVALGQAIGLALGLLTSPRIDLVQNAIYDAIVNTGLYGARAAAAPEFAQQFGQAYEGAWQSLRLFTGYPTWSTTVAAAATAIIGGFLNWLIYGLLAHWTARWFGGQSSYSRFMGPLALSYAPLLLGVILLFPGAVRRHAADLPGFADGEVPGHQGDLCTGPGPQPGDSAVSVPARTTDHACHRHLRHRVRHWANSIP